MKTKWTKDYNNWKTKLIPIPLENYECIDSGSYSEVYQVSDKLVIKVLNQATNRYTLELVTDEIFGTSRFKCSCGIKNIVKIKDQYNKRYYWALVKPYIKGCIVTDSFKKEIFKRQITEQYPGDFLWDISPDNNTIIDKNNKIWIIDTQTNHPELLSYSQVQQRINYSIRYLKQKRINPNLLLQLPTPRKRSKAYVENLLQEQI